MLVGQATNTEIFPASSSYKDKKQNIKTVEGSRIVSYKKMKKKDLFSLYDRVYEKYRSELSNYENSFSVPNKAPDLFLSNNLHQNNEHLHVESYIAADQANNINNNNNNHNNALKHYFQEKFKRNSKVKDGFDEMTRKKNLESSSKTQHFNYDNMKVTSLEYTGLLNQTYFNQEFSMLNSIISQLFINNSIQKQKVSTNSKSINSSNCFKKKYRLSQVNVNSFDFYDEYKEEFLKAKEELLLQEAANFIMTYMGKKNKGQAQSVKFREIAQNNFFEEFLNKIIRKVEVRKDNNELVSVEYIVNMIREEIDSNNTDPIMLNKLNKRYEDCASQDNNNNNINSVSSFLPPINSKPMSLFDEEKKKVPFLDYEMVANVKRLKKKHKKASFLKDGESDCESGGDAKRKKTFGRYVKDINGNWIFEEVAEGEKPFDSVKRKSKYNNEKEEEEEEEDVDESFNKKKVHHRKSKRENSLKDISEEANKNLSENDGIETQNKRKRRKNKFLAKIKTQQSPKSEFEYQQYFTDENNAEMRKSFNLHMRFQKTHFNFLNKIDTFFLTTHSSGFDDLGHTLGPIGYSYKKKLNQLLKKTQEVHYDKNNNNNKNYYERTICIFEFQFFN